LNLFVENGKPSQKNELVITIFFKKTKKWKETKGKHGMPTIKQLY
jgi:hypothetical protein